MAPKSVSDDVRREGGGFIPGMGSGRPAAGGGLLASATATLVGTFKDFGDVSGV